MKKNFKLLCCSALGLLSLGACTTSATQPEVKEGQNQEVNLEMWAKTNKKHFPYYAPKEKPTDIQLSTAQTRIYDEWKAVRPEDNELYSRFFYTEPTGFDYNQGDGTITRRDPSRVIKVKDTYYVYYTYRHTATTHLGPEKCTDVIPSSDWDLCEIWYATSTDGFHWKEQGVAVKRPAKGEIGQRSISTPDVLVWKGKYYVYFQAFDYASGTKGGDDCPVSCAVSDSPDGPFIPCGKIIIPNGGKEDWDGYSIHDPYPMVFHGKIYFYWKSDYNGKGTLKRSTGLAIAEDPLGPFVKCPQNPVLNSGHETGLFKYKSGIAALCYKNGHESNTIQYSEDGINFHIAAISTMLPYAAGLYDPDAFVDTKEAKGVTWGLSHVYVGDWGLTHHCELLRFDCDLSTAVNTPELKNTMVNYSKEELLMHGLSKQEYELRLQQGTITK